jgi:eukaryotic-like serine/threonine-protein kinase
MQPLVCPLCRIALPTTDDVCPRDGRVGVAADWLVVPPTLAQRFRVLEPFAHGDTGSMYLADEPETARRGLLKILTPAAKEQLTDRQRLRRELVKQALLQRSNLIVPLASGDADGTTWVFREWLDGVSLEVRLSREGALQQTEALAIAAQVATALDELHRGGLLHRDVKPGHVFLQPTQHGVPRAYLLDAGLAVALQTRSGTRLQGTPGYLAPEQITGNLVSFRSDLYSLGCVLYRMLTGCPAFAGDTREDILAAQRRGELPPIPATLPNGIAALLQSILAKDPQDRPFSAQKLRRTLEPFLPDGALMEKQPTSTFETVPEPRPSAAPQASGTLRPPPPPSTRPAPTGGTLRPPLTPPRAKAPQDRTQQIDLEHLIEVEEVAQGASSAKRPTSVPPPMPAHASQPPSRKPQPPSEKTQPIRLDQILAVAAARKSEQPPRAPEPEPPRAPEPEPAVVVDEAPLFTASEPTEEASEPSLADDEQYDEDATTELPTSLRDEIERERAAETSAAETSAARTAATTAKATLMGIGGDPLEQPLPMTALAADTAGKSERDHPTERIARSAEDTSDPSLAVTGSVSASTLLGGLAGRGDSRRLLMYASAALVGLGVLGVGASALMSDDEPRVAAVAPPPPPPSPASAEPASEVVAQAQPPRPVIEPLAVATPAKSDEPPATTTSEQAATPAASRGDVAAEPSASARESDSAQLEERADTREDKLAAREARRREREARREARAAKTAPVATPVVADKGGDKAAQFAEAREQARSHYAAKRYKEAAAAYERASKLDPNHPGTYAGLGAARLQTNDAKGALTAYQRAVQLSPDTSGFHAALGRAYLANGDKAKAVSAYKRALQLDPKNEAAKSALRQLGG